MRPFLNAILTHLYLTEYSNIMINILISSLIKTVNNKVILKTFNSTTFDLQTNRDCAISRSAAIAIFKDTMSKR